MSTRLVESTVEAERIKEKHKDELLQAARRVALGEEIDAEEIERLTTAAGEEPRAFLSLVSSLTFRAKLRARAAEESVHQARYDQILAEVAEENRILDAAVREHQRVCGPLQKERSGLVKLLGELASIPSDLMRSCPDPQLKRLWVYFSQERERNHNQQRAMQDRVAGLQAVRCDPKDLDGIAMHKRQLADAERQLAELERKGEELRLREEQNYQEMVDY